MKTLLAYLRDESGAAAAEYALILAIVSVAIATAMTGLGNAVITAIGKAATAVTAA